MQVSDAVSLSRGLRGGHTCVNFGGDGLGRSRQPSRSGVEAKAVPSRHNDSGASVIGFGKGKVIVLWPPNVSHVDTSQTASIACSTGSV